MSTSYSEKKSLAGSAAVVAGATSFSRVLGLAREQLMAYLFGASLATDAFITAFRIPNLLRDMFAEGALSSAFVPVFKKQLVTETKEEAFLLANRVISGILVIVGLIVLLGIIAAPIIIYVSANGFTENPFKFDLTVHLTQVMFVYLLLVSLSALVMGMLNSFGRFAIPALSPALFNVGTIVSAVSLYRFLELPIYALAIGVLLGGLGQLLVQLPALLKTGYRFRFHFDLLDEQVKKVARLFIPMVAGMSAGRVNILVNTLLASFLMEGSISYLNYSYRLMHFPLGVFAVALGTVVLPRAAEQAAKGDREGLAATFNDTLILNLLLIVPSMVFLALMGHEIVAVVFQWGSFSSADTGNTALALLHYSYGLVGFAAVRVTTPVYYALGDSKLPMKVSLVTVAVNMALYYPMIQILDFAGLAAATSIASLCNIALLIYFLPRRGILLQSRHLLLSATRILVAAVVAFYCARLIPDLIGTQFSGADNRFFVLLVPLIVGSMLYLLFCWILRIKEAGLLFRLVRRRKG